jgi:hypothetical protein
MFSSRHFNPKDFKTVQLRVKHLKKTTALTFKKSSSGTPMLRKLLKKRKTLILQLKEFRRDKHLAHDP